MNRKIRPLLVGLGFLLVLITVSIGAVLGEDQVDPVPTMDSIGIEQPVNPPADPPATDVATPEQPTDVPPTESPTETPTPDVTEVVATETPAATLETLPAATVEMTETPVESNPEATAEPEATELPLATAPVIEVSMICDSSGLSFELSNTGSSMDSADSYLLTLDGTMTETLVASETPMEFMLLADEKLLVPAGFGLPTLLLGEVTFQPETPCLPVVLPVLDVEAVCTFEKGVIFTLTNSGSAMLEAQDYTIVDDAGEAVSTPFQMAEAETLEAIAGYGTPIFSTGEWIVTLDVPCDAPTIISGTVWQDKNGDGLYGGDEPGIAGMTVNLTDVGGNVRTWVTQADGGYTFDNLPVGDYIISVDATALPMYMRVFPVENSVTLHAAGENTTADFGYILRATASISGSVWLDRSNYSVRDGGEGGIAGTVVELVDASGTVLASAAVNPANGAYTFTELPAGDYTIRLNQSTLFAPNVVSWNSDSQCDYETPITLSPNQALTAVDFGIVGSY
jgi:hypothetical protein